MSRWARVFGIGGVLAIILAAAPMDVAAQKKKDKKNAKEYPTATDADYKSIQKQKELVGTLVSINDMSLTLRVDYPRMESNPKYKPPKDKSNAVANEQYQMWKTYNDLQTQMQKAAQAKSPQQAAKIQARINLDMARLQQQYFQLSAKGVKFDPNNSPFITVTDTKDFDLDVQEKVVYRRLTLPSEFDDMGNIKTYTDKEKAELRGDDKTKPGYTAKADDFGAGVAVKLSLTAPKKKEKDKDADKDDVTPEEVARPTVNMIVLTKDAPTTTSTPPPEKKKKKT